MVATWQQFEWQVAWNWDSPIGSILVCKQYCGFESMDHEGWISTVSLVFWFFSNQCPMYGLIHGTGLNPSLPTSHFHQHGTWLGNLLLILIFLIWYGFTTVVQRCHCLLRALHFKLLTRFLTEPGSGTDWYMPPLEAKPESIPHLFFNFSFSAYIWSLCRLKLSITNAIIGSLPKEALLLKDKI